MASLSCVLRSGRVNYSFYYRFYCDNIIILSHMVNFHDMGLSSTECCGGCPAAGVPQKRPGFSAGLSAVSPSAYGPAAPSTGLENINDTEYH